MGPDILIQWIQIMKCISEISTSFDISHWIAAKKRTEDVSSMFLGIITWDENKHGQELLHSLNS